MKSSTWKCSGEDKLLLRHRISSHPVEQIITSAPLADFPEPPQITAKSVSLDEAARATLLDALACASDDETRVILNGAYLDVSEPTVVITPWQPMEGICMRVIRCTCRCLPPSLVPDHRFLSWSGFVKDGLWKLAVQPPTKEKGGLSPSGEPPLDVREQAGRGKHTPIGETSPTMSASSPAPSKISDQGAEAIS